THRIYTLSLHDALPISACEALSPGVAAGRSAQRGTSGAATGGGGPQAPPTQSTITIRAVSAARACSASSSNASSKPSPSSSWRRSEEHTSELQSLAYLV